LYGDLSRTRLAIPVDKHKQHSFLYNVYRTQRFPQEIRRLEDSSFRGASPREGWGGSRWGALERSEELHRVGGVRQTGESASGRHFEVILITAVQKNRLVTHVGFRIHRRSGSFRAETDRNRSAPRHIAALEVLQQMSGPNAVVRVYVALPCGLPSKGGASRGAERFALRADRCRSEKCVLSRRSNVTMPTVRPTGRSTSATMSLPSTEPLRFGDTISLAAVDAGGFLCCDAGLTSLCFVDHSNKFDSVSMVRFAVPSPH